MGRPKEIAKRLAKAVGAYEAAKSLKNRAYVFLRDREGLIGFGMARLFRFLPPESLARLSREFDEKGVLKYIESAIEAQKRMAPAYQPGSSSPFNLRALYVLCRHLKPPHAVETGVASGASSFAILTAMEENGEGTLHSIDLPPEEWEGRLPEYRIMERVSLPPHRRPGWLVPGALRNRWDLILGDSEVELGRLLGRLGAIGLFYHDAQHTYEAMTREYSAAWPHLAPGGVLASDDVGWNEAFSDFSKDAGGEAGRWFSFGMIRKR